MARMHARRRGKSGSSRPMISENPEWVPLSKSEVEETIVKLGKDGVLSARIGLIMRDQYAVPDVKLATGKTVTQILKENDLAPNLPDDLVALMRTAINLQVHLNANKKDVANKGVCRLLSQRSDA